MIPSRPVAACMVVLSMAVLAPSLGGSQIEPLDLKALPEQASLVVLGHVITTRTTQDDSAFLEKTSTLRVVSVLRGQHAERELRVRTRTGLVFFDRHLEPGRAGVFFLKPSPRGDFEAAYPGSFALFGKGTYKSTAVMMVTLEEADRIRALAARYLVDEKKVTDSLPLPGKAAIDPFGTMRLGGWILEDSSSESVLRLTFRIAETNVNIVREEMKIQRAGNDWKILGMSQVIYHRRR